MPQMHQGNIGLRARVAELAADPNAKLVIVGVTAVALAPVVLPLVRPVLKATIRSGVTLFERTKSAIAETGEVLADIAAEARAEAHAEVQKKATLQAARPMVQSAAED
ncbi:DUF5132 domain-containing protein [Egbenema bharatensis]|uniref:DUF5132 domain-containing protein n=1 Tax=Egbenema bharatensis TaxID=3463334 RepID=UPI003A885014